MGKRSTFERLERDFYRTPPQAVTPLLPHLIDGSTFFEPCAGDGALIWVLQRNGFRNVGCIDIEPQHPEIDQSDALELSGVLADFIITNPPWNRKVLHPMIEQFSAMRPTWLLFDADWIHTKQSAPFMPWCRKIVSVGRVKWFPESKMTGKDNCAWHLFDQNADGPTVFCGRDVDSAEMKQGILI